MVGTLQPDLASLQEDLHREAVSLARQRLNDDKAVVADAARGKPSPHPMSPVRKGESRVGKYRPLSKSFTRTHASHCRSAQPQFYG